jgi:hypothetical protein
VLRYKFMARYQRRGWNRAIVWVEDITIALILAFVITLAVILLRPEHP